MKFFLDQYNLIDIPSWLVFLIAGIVIAFAIGLYLLRSVAIYKLAKNHNVKNAFLAFIPAVWIYTACRLVAEMRFFGVSFGKFALFAAIIFSVLEALTATFNVISYLPLVGYYLSGGEIIWSTEAIILGPLWQEYAFSMPTFYCYVSKIVYPYNFKVLSVLYNGTSILLSALSLVSLVIEINLYVAIFRKFWPQHYIVAAVVSVFGLFPIFAFIIRNKKAVSYADYLRSKGYTVIDMGEYNRQNSNNHGNSPFSDFDDKTYDDDPFSEFSDDKKE